MKTNMQTLMSWMAIAPLVVALLALPACGGGSGPQPPLGAVSPPTTVVTERPLVAIGRCYTCGAAINRAGNIELDGERLQAAALGVESVGLARGKQSVTNDGGRWRTDLSLDTVTASTVVVGAVEWVDLRRGRIGVLGQDVQGDGSWIVSRSPTGSATTGLGLGAIRVGDRVRVNGFDGPDDAILGLAVLPAADGMRDRATGTLRSLDVVARRLRLGGLDVDYATASIEDFPTGEPRVGDRIEVVGQLLRPGLLWASTVRRRDSIPQIDVGSFVSIDGLLGRAARRGAATAPDAVDLLVAGYSVSVAGDCGDVRNLRVGERVYVRGVMSAAGVLSRDPTLLPVGDCYAARSGSGGDVNFEATVETTDAARAGFSAFGVEVYVPIAALVHGLSGERLATPLAVGDRVEIWGWQSLSSDTLLAPWIRRVATAPGAAARFDARVSAADTDRLVLLGRSLRIDAATRTTYANCIGYTSSGSKSIAPDQLIPTQFFANGSAGALRWARGTMERMPDGAWRAVAVEIYDPDCE